MSQQDRHVCFEDKASMPYTEATLMEVRRISTPFPVTPPRTSREDVVIQVHVGTRCFGTNCINLMLYREGSFPLESQCR